MRGVYADIKDKTAMLERIPISVVLRGKVPAQIGFFETCFSGKHVCLLTSHFCGLCKFIWTDTSLNGWSAWSGGHLRVLFLIDDYL